MCILHTLAAYHSCRACIACTLLLEHHPSAYRGSGSDVDGMSHAILGNGIVDACIYAYCICITFLVAIVACSVRYQMHQLPGITLGLPGMYHMHVYHVHSLIASFVHYREVIRRGIWALLEDWGLAARAGRKLVAQATLELSSCIHSQFHSSHFIPFFDFRQILPLFFPFSQRSQHYQQ